MPLPIVSVLPIARTDINRNNYKDVNFCDLRPFLDSSDKKEEKLRNMSELEKIIIDFVFFLR